MELYQRERPERVVVCVDELGPVRVGTYRGQTLLAPPSARQSRPRATQELDWGHRGGGFIFGALIPLTGEALTVPFDRRTGANWFAFLERLERWVHEVSDAQEVVVILDNLATHKTLDSALFRAAHPHWTFCFQPTRAAWLNLIEPWWRVLRSLALAGRRFATWDEIATAVATATTYGNAHRHPFVWGRPRPLRQQRRVPGVGHAPIFLPHELAG